MTQLKAHTTYNGDNKSGIMTIESLDGTPIDIADIKDIHWGASGSFTELNMCDMASQYYKIKGDPIDLSGPTAEVILTSMT